ncbi:MAG: DUF624 domain-containing protein [candidate division Zixibacteria bacterium]|nr:DUF624 domain-containing protein [candidate division Zixibacteria bacterium]
MKDMGTSLWQSGNVVKKRSTIIDHAAPKVNGKFTHGPREAVQKTVASPSVKNYYPILRVPDSAGIRIGRKTRTFLRFGPEDRTLPAKTGHFSGICKKWLWNVYDYAGTLIVLNILWAICALPVVTLPAATAGLFGVSNRIAGYEEVRLRDFFTDMRRGFYRSFRLCAVYTTVLGLLGVNIVFYVRWMEPWLWLGVMLSGVMFWTGVFVALTGLYSFPMLMRIDGPVRQTLKTGALLTLDNPRISVLLLLAGIVVLSISALTIAGLFLGGVGVLSVLCSTGFREVRKRYDAPVSAEEETDREEVRTWRDLFRPWEHR